MALDYNSCQPSALTITKIQLINHLLNIMNIKYLSTLALLAIMAISFNVSARNIDSTTASAVANSFLKQYVSNGHNYMTAPALSDLKLAHAEPSAAVASAKCYYAFNIKGGGFIIISGEDRANQVLGFSDKGHLDFNNLPDNFKALMRSYKEEIEFLQSHPDLNVTPAVRAATGNEVNPLIKTNWGQEMPYCLQCPVYQGEYCVVGCVATAMAQVMYYWQYPTTCSGVNAYYCYSIGQTLPSLPETTFEYNKMLPSYCHWDWDLKELIQDTYTDQQAEAVAKLSRYCGQAVDMSYSPDGSGAYVNDQLSAMKDFGYSSSARDVSRSSWWGTEYYTTAQWEAMIREELDKHQPILYSANDPDAGGHAFICDGYNSEGLFHFNFGWYGTCDGWYASTALNMTHRDGDYLKFNSGHEMLLGVVPPTYCVISTDGLEASSGLLVLGENINIQAENVNIMTSNTNINLMFSLNNSTGRRVAASNAIGITCANFEQGSTVSSALALPATLEKGSYDLQFHYYISSPRVSFQINCPAGKLNVIGHLAKYNAAWTIEDLTTLLDYLLTGSHSAVELVDVTTLIDTLITGE